MSIKVKLTKVISKQAYDLDLLVRAMDGEEVKFPSLEESEAAHLRCSLRRLNRIGEVPAGSTEACAPTKHLQE